MSPSRACMRHGRPNCQLCAADRRARAQSTRRSYSGTAAERAMRVAVLETYGSSCHYCGAPIDLDAGAADPLELAHLTPHRDGGPFVLENLRASHRSCNRAAGAGGPS